MDNGGEHPKATGGNGENIIHARSIHFCMVVTLQADSVNTVVYGDVMTARLTRVNWLDHGLKVLASSGAAALKAEPLAASLKVSRGSFYWHFRDIGQFHVELLARWRQRATDDIIALIDRETSHDARLQLLMRIALAGDDRLERSIRSWASQNRVAADAVASVDKIRIEYLSQLLRSAGIPEKRASARATFLYWAYAGRTMVAPDQKKLDPEELDAIAKLMQS